MTEDDMKVLALDVGAALQPYATAGKIAGYRLIIAMYVGDTKSEYRTIAPMVTGSAVSEEVERILQNPDFTRSADAKAKTEVRRDS